ncbi:MAG TPA: ACT domain-containing protein [Terriglobia bacterium]|jgi:glycine cleavage system transcriptional repressor
MAERDHLILTATGPDRVGLVQQLSRFISNHGCNIEDSKLAVFCGEFAIILLITGESASLATISQNRQQIETESGLEVKTRTPSASKPSEFLLPYKLVASCMDHPGIVYQISGLLSGLGINIQSLETTTYPAPVSGAPLFRLEAQLAVPARMNINDLRERLDQLQRDENIDIELTTQKN